MCNIGGWENTEDLLINNIQEEHSAVARVPNKKKHELRKYTLYLSFVSFFVKIFILRSIVSDTSEILTLHTLQATWTPASRNV